WCNYPLPPGALADLQAGVLPHRLVLSANSKDDALADADVAVGQPDPQKVIDSPRIKWVHVTSAGDTNYDTPAFRQALEARGIPFTNSSTIYNKPCAEHIVGMMFAFARQLQWSLDNQRGPKAWPQKAIRANSFLLEGQTALIYGFGAI